jgi:hypothetical protein
LLRELLRRLERQERIGKRVAAALNRQAKADEELARLLRAEQAERERGEWWKRDDTTL